MKINTKVRYGLRTMIELGCHSNKEGLHQKDIAESQQLSEKYLDMIISSLKVAGLIINIGGKKSGYILNKSTKQITILDIFKAFEADPAIVPCINRPSVCERSKNCPAQEYWEGLNNVITAYLKNAKLDTLVKRCKEMHGASAKKVGGKQESSSRRQRQYAVKKKEAAAECS